MLGNLHLAAELSFPDPTAHGRGVGWGQVSLHHGAGKPAAWVPACAAGWEGWHVPPPFPRDIIWETSLQLLP